MTHFKLANLAPIILIVFIIKSFILEPSSFDFGIIALMTYGLVSKLKNDKKEVDAKDEVMANISVIEKRLSDKVAELEHIQMKDREVYEGKFSTLSLGIHKKTTDTKANAYGWR